LFKVGKHAQAIVKYTTAASYAVQRPPWEGNQFMREELSVVVSNRSAAYLESRDYIAALADAEMVIQLRRNWGKGHFRKAKTLVAMNRLQDASEALKLGLAFDPSSAVRVVIDVFYSPIGLFTT
jgi:translocation protein SEC72